MMLTAHGGAMNTGRNTQRYFDEMRKYAMEAIEVDIWKRGKVLFLSHSVPGFCIKNKIRLEYVLEYCRERGIKVNCDVKMPGIVKDVVALAKKCNAIDNIYFTGMVTRRDIKHLDGAEAYLNDTFFGLRNPFTVKNLDNIKRIMTSLQNPYVTGINFRYRYATDELIEKAAALGIKISLYTVDDVDALKTLLTKNIANITTNLIANALRIRSEGAL